MTPELYCFRLKFLKREEGQIKLKKTTEIMVLLVDEYNRNQETDPG